MSDPEIGFHGSIPILSVQSHAVSLDFYVRVLGFKIDWHISGMASVSRGCCSVMLCEGLQGHPGTWVWIGVSDAEALHHEFTARGATVRLPPTNYPWALEFHVEDPDRHVLRFGAERKEDRPFSPWVAWYERPPAVDSTVSAALMTGEFREAVRGLMAGDFSRLAPLLASGPDGSSGAIVRWHDAGWFAAEPMALAEAFTCACFNGCVDVAEHLLACGVDPSGGARTGLNAFHWATNRGHLAITRLLLRHRAPLEIRNSYGGTVLGGSVWAAIHETKPTHPQIIDALLAAGANVREAEYPSGDAGIDEILHRYGAGT